MDDSWPMVMSSSPDLARFYRFTTVVPSGGYVGLVFSGSRLSGGLRASCVRGGPGCAPVFATGGRSVGLVGQKKGTGCDF